MILLSSTGESIYQLIVVVFCFILVLVLTYYSTRWMAGYQKKQGISKNLQVAETLKISTNKYIQLIQVGEDRYFLIASGKDEVTFLGEVSAQDLKERPEVREEDIPTVQGDFADILQKVKAHMPKK
jgi:flagellar protein FliO/FliZ